VKNKDKDKDKTSGSKRPRENTEVAWGVADSVLGGKTKRRAKEPRVVACKKCKKDKKGPLYCWERGCQ